MSKPIISSVSEITTSIHQTIIISGSGFGNTPPKMDSAFDGSPLTFGCNVNTPYLDIRDTAGASDTWEAGKEDCTVSDKIGIYIQNWTDSQIVLAGFGSELYTGGVPGQFNIANGDPITVEVYGSGTSGMSSYQTIVGMQPTQNTPPTSPTVTQQGNGPVITSVTPITTSNQQTIKIIGQGFGANPTIVKNTGSPNDGSVDTERPGTQCHVNTPSIMITDTSEGWNAADTDCTGGDWIGVYLTNWTDNEIDLNGFGSELGSGGLWRIANGDSITIKVFGPNNDGVATYQITVGAQSNANPLVSTTNTQSQSLPSSATSISVGSNPNGIVFASSNNDMYVANSGSNTVSVISSTANNVITTINVGINPSAVAYDPANQDVYVTNEGSNNVSVISTSDNIVTTTIPVGTGPNNLAYDSANQEMYIANSGNSPGPSNTVSAISSTTNTVVSTITVDPNPIRLAFDPSNNDIYVDNYASGEVTVIDGTGNAVIKTISVGANPNTVGYDPANNDMYVTSNNSDNVSVISGTTNNVIATLNVGTNPFGVFYDPANQEMFVSSTVGNTVSAIGNDNTVTTINVGDAPYQMTFDPSDNNMYVSDTAALAGGGTPDISVIGSNNALVATLTVGTDPSYSIFDPSNNGIYVSNSGSGTVSVIYPKTTVESQPSETIAPQQSPQNQISSNCSTTGVPTIDNYNIAGAESLNLNSGSCEYFFIGSTAGGFPMNQITWNQDLQVTASYSDNLAISIGNQASNTGSYYSQAGNHGMAGVGVSGFGSYSTFTASTPSSNTLSTTFSTTNPNDLVLILVGGEGDGNLTLSGIQAQTLADQTYSEAGSNVIASEAIYKSQLPVGTYNLNVQSITYPTNSGTSLGIVVYVLHPASGSSQTYKPQIMAEQQTGGTSTPSTNEYSVSCTDQLGITCNFVQDKNGLYDLILTIPPPTGNGYRLFSNEQINRIANSMTAGLQQNGFGIPSTKPSYVSSVTTQNLININAVELVDDLIDAPTTFTDFISSGSDLGIPGYGLSTAEVLSSDYTTEDPPEIVANFANEIFSGDEKENEQGILASGNSGNFLININQQPEPYYPTYMIGPKQYLVLSIDSLQLPSQENSFTLNIPISWVDLAIMYNNLSIQPPTSANAPPESFETLTLQFNSPNNAQSSNQQTQSTPTTQSSPQSTQQSFSVTFTESGLPVAGGWFCLWWCGSVPNWSITLDGNTQTSTSTTISFNNVNSGTSYSVTTPSGYSASPATGTIQVSGNTNQTITFSQNQ